MSEDGARDRFGWTAEGRQHKQRELRADLGNDVYLLDDPKFARMGDRFGAILLYHDPARRSGSRYHFSDYGPYLPKDRRPPGAIEDEDYALCCEGREDDQRRAVMDHWTQRRVGPLTPRAAEAASYASEYSPDPVLRIRCSTPSKHGRPCRRLLGTVVGTPHGHLIAARTHPAYDERLLHLEHLHDAVAEGRIAQDELDAYVSDHGVDYQTLIEDALHEDALLIGCPDHGDATVAASLVLADALSTRRTLNIDAAADLIGYDRH